MPTHRFAIIEAPSVLGLFPGGAETLPDALLAAGLAERLGARRAGRVKPPAYSGRRDPKTAVLNSAGIAEYSVALADAVGAVVDAGEFPVVLGGDCSIVLGCLLALRRRGRHGLLFLDAHADFYQPEAEPAGEAASMELAFATGRGPRELADLEGRGPSTGSCRGDRRDARRAAATTAAGTGGMATWPRRQRERRGAARATARSPHSRGLRSRPRNAPEPTPRPVSVDAPNGIHFHPPAGLLIPGARTPARHGLSDRMLAHHLDRCRELVRAAGSLPAADLERPLRPGLVVVWFEGEEASAADMLRRLVGTLEVWVAAIAGEPVPEFAGPLEPRLTRAGTALLRLVRRIRDRGAWDGAFIDALCEPPQTFTFGAALSHILSFGAVRPKHSPRSSPNSARSSATATPSTGSCARDDPPKVARARISARFDGRSAAPDTTRPLADITDKCRKVAASDDDAVLVLDDLACDVHPTRHRPRGRFPAPR